MCRLRSGFVLPADVTQKFRRCPPWGGNSHALPLLSSCRALPTTSFALSLAYLRIDQIAALSLLPPSYSLIWRTAAISESESIANIKLSQRGCYLLSQLSSCQAVNSSLNCTWTLTAIPSGRERKRQLERFPSLLVLFFWQLNHHHCWKLQVLSHFALEDWYASDFLWRVWEEEE